VEFLGESDRRDPVLHRVCCLRRIVGFKNRKSGHWGLDTNTRRNSYYDPGNNTHYRIPVTTGTETSTSATAPTSVGSGTTTPTTATTTTHLCTGSVEPSAPPAIIPSRIPSEPIPTVPSRCGNWNGLDNCARGVYTFPASAEKRRWQTPPEGGNGYIHTFQDYHDLVGYADIQYGSNRTRAVVVVNAASRTGERLTYWFNGASQSSNTFQVNSGLTGQLAIRITGSNGSTLVLEPLNFIWQNAPLTAAQSTFSDGQKGGIVELFGWPYDDIAKECAFLGKAGWMGVKIWPPTEHVWGSHYYEPDNQFRPWYLLYQPVSYRLHSRMGTRAQLRAMIQTCRTAGVRVYADAVINHMVAQGNGRFTCPPREGLTSHCC